MAVILALGDVGAWHLEPLESALSRQNRGKAPAVVRISEHYATTKVFVERLAWEYPDGVDEGFDSRLHSLAAEFVDGLLGGGEDVLAVLFGLQPEGFAPTSALGFDLLMGCLSPKVEVFEVHPTRLKAEAGGEVDVNVGDGHPLFDLSRPTRFKPQ